MILRELLIQYEMQNDLSHSEVADQIGVSLSTYYRWINGESTKLKKTTIQKISSILDCDIESVIEESNRVKPILGNVKAGYDLWAEQDIEGYIELGKADAQKGDYFLHVVGDSMEGCHIFDGDIAYIQQCDTVQNGQIAVIMIGEEVTVKKVYFKNEFLFLQAANPKYETKIYSKEEVSQLPVKIIGLVRFVRTDFV